MPKQVGKTKIELTRAQLTKMIDHTQVRAFATQVDMSELCKEAVTYGFGAISVNSVWISYCAKKLAGTGVAVGTTVGFPLGTTTAHLKVEETIEARRNGANEVDMVINIGALKSGFPKFVEEEIAAVVKAAKKMPVKVILETCYLSRAEKIAVCKMSVRAGAAFVKTATGFGTAGATPEDVALMRKTVGQQIGVKAAGGIRSYRDVLTMIEAGANRIGTRSSVAIMEELPA